jgi:pyrimidine deaminase RibD-like protein
MKKSDDNIRDQVNQLIRHEIQDVINEYVDDKENTEKSGLGFIENEDELKVSVSQKEIDKIIKQYKKIKKSQRSNLFQIKKLGDG